MSRMIRALLWMALAAVTMAGCSRYTLIEPKARTIADVYTVEPQIAWSGISDGKWEVWTVDGPALEAIQFLKGLPDGEPLFRGTPEQKRVTFRKTMSPSEISEFVIDGYSSLGVQKATVSNLRPAKFGDKDGFRFEFQFVTRNGLEKRAMVAGAVLKERLFLILYSGTALHYYTKQQTEAEKIIESIRMK
jgi:hypothetical protein